MKIHFNQGLLQTVFREVFSPQREITFISRRLSVLIKIKSLNYLEFSERRSTLHWNGFNRFLVYRENEKREKYCEKTTNTSLDNDMRKKKKEKKKIVGQEE